MKAMTYSRYGGPEVLRMAEVPQPVPTENEVLVRVHTASIGAGEWHLLTADMFAVRFLWGLFKPKLPVLGFDLAGTVEAVGAKVTRFAPGDAVFGASAMNRAGAFAEYAVVAEDGLVAKPDSVSFEAAAAVPTSACAALHGLRDHGHLREGATVLINGASGGVGTFAVQIAKALGARVTAVCSTAKVDTAHTLGAGRVIDYTQQDPTQTGDRYDVVLDIVGTWPFPVCKRLLTDDGLYVAAAGGVSRLARISLMGGNQLKAYFSEPNQPDLVTLRDWLADGTLRPVIDRRYPLAELPAALAYVGEGHAAGKVVVDTL